MDVAASPDAGPPGREPDCPCPRGSTRPGCVSLLTAAAVSQRGSSAYARRTQRVAHDRACFSLFEVEAVLRRHPAVRDLLAFEVTDAHQPAGRIGVAVVLHGHTRRIGVAELCLFGRAYLAVGMLPELVICVDRLPSSRTGIVDRLRLPSSLGCSIADGSGRHWDGALSTLPQCEALVSEAMASLSGVSPDSGALQRPFLDLGIDSLRGEQLVRRLNHTLAPLLELRPSVVYDHPSIRQLAEFILAQLSCESKETAACSTLSMDDFDTTAANAASRTSRRRSERLALLGRAIRAPGAPHTAHLFALAASGGDSMQQVPSMRWSAPALVRCACTSCRHGGFVGGAQRFDHARFEILPSEARAMDPQQRLLLEVAYSATHEAELHRADLLGCEAGVFVGIMNTDFEGLLAGPARP